MWELLFVEQTVISLLNHKINVRIVKINNKLRRKMFLEINVAFKLHDTVEFRDGILERK